MATALSSDQASRLQTNVNMLPTLGESKQLSVSTTSARVQFNTNCARVSVTASAQMFITVGGPSVTATTTGTTAHYIAANERLEFLLNLDQHTYIAAVMSSGTGTLYISELG